MNDIHTNSTSRTTAQADDIVLRDTDKIRLIFRPTIVDNSKNKDAAVKGIFLYQKKIKSDKWEDFQSIPLTSVKTGEGYKLELRSEELLTLLNELQPLYSIREEAGVPRGKQTYVKLTPQLEQLRGFASQDVRGILNANRKLGATMLSKLLSWAVNLEDSSLLIEKFVELDPSSLGKLNAAIGLRSLKNSAY